jgi:hypothetical protein
MQNPITPFLESSSRRSPVAGLTIPCPAFPPGAPDAMPVQPRRPTRARGSVPQRVLVLLLFVWTGLAAAALAQTKQPASGPRRDSAQSQHAQLQELLELARSSQAAAARAEAEARLAREQISALRQQYEQTAQELAALRQLLEQRQPAPALEQRLAELSATVRQLQNAAPRSAKEAVSAEQTAASTATPDAPPLAPPQEERLARLEEQTELNTTQIQEHAQTKVEAEGRFRVKLYGMVLANTFLNTSDSSQNASPTNAPAPSTYSTVRQRNSGATVRQTTLGLLMQGPRVGSARLSAQAEFDFYGGASESYEGSVLGALRLRTASARIDSERHSLIVGLREPLISPLNPTSLAAVWYPALSEAGNLWQWRPQALHEYRLPVGEASELIVQNGVLMPFGETLESVLIEGGPSYEGRAAWRRTLDSDRHFEIGVAGMIGKRTFPYRHAVTAYSLNTDWNVPLGERFTLSGEAFFGRSINLSEQSGARADSSFALSGPLLRDTSTLRGIHLAGGWAQLAFKARRDLDFHLAFGQEDPRNRDIFDGLRNPATQFKNQAATANFIYRLQQNFLISLEFRRLWTDYTAGRRRNDHYNLAVGYSF